MAYTHLRFIVNGNTYYGQPMDQTVYIGGSHLCRTDFKDKAIQIYYKRDSCTDMWDEGMEIEKTNAPTGADLKALQTYP